MLIISVSRKFSEGMYLDQQYDQFNSSLKVVFRYLIILISLFLFLSYSNYPYLHYFMPFRNISCSTFTIWCNKHNQHFTVTHNTQHSADILSLYFWQGCALLLFPFKIFNLFCLFPDTPFLRPTTEQQITFQILLENCSEFFKLPNSNRGGGNVSLSDSQHLTPFTSALLNVYSPKKINQYIFIFTDTDYRRNCFFARLSGLSRLLF